MVGAPGQRQRLAGAAEVEADHPQAPRAAGGEARHHGRGGGAGQAVEQRRAAAGPPARRGRVVQHQAVAVGQADDVLAGRGAGPRAARVGQERLHVGVAE